MIVKDQRASARESPTSQEQRSYIMNNNHHPTACRAPVNVGWVNNESLPKLAPLAELKTPKCGDPVDMLTGAFIFERTDLALGVAAPGGLRLQRFYTSANATRNGPLGYGLEPRLRHPRLASQRRRSGPGAAPAGGCRGAARARTGRSTGLPCQPGSATGAGRAEGLVGSG